MGDYIMGYASRNRGTYEQRKAEAITKREAEWAEYDRLATERERVFLSNSKRIITLTALLAAISMGVTLK